MSHLMKRNELAEVLLARRGEPGLFLRSAGQKRKRGKVKQAGPALAERAGNLGDGQLMKRKRPGKAFIEMDGRIDLFRQMF